MTLIFAGLGFLMLLAIGACAVEDARAIAMVEQSLLEGIAEDRVTVFRGVLFAAPPVDDLRWREPAQP